MKVDFPDSLSSFKANEKYWKVSIAEKMLIIKSNDVLLEGIHDLWTKNKDKYAIGCEAASMLSVLEGISNTISKKEFMKRYKDKQLTAVDKRTDWIPGDMGGFENPHPIGEFDQGQNIIYLGEDLWWGHVPKGQKNTRKLEEWNGNYKLLEEKLRPLIGLSD